MLPVAVGVTLALVLPHPWNGIGLAAALLWELAGTLFGLWWSQRAAPLVGAGTLIGLTATVVTACAPRGRVKIGGETWEARSRTTVEPGQSVRVCSVEGLTLHVEPQPPAQLPPQRSERPTVSGRSLGSQGGWLWVL